MAEWEPISTAPKDDEILVAEGFSVFVAYWVTGRRYTGWSSGSDDSYPEMDYENPCEPTHWMPLPEPPQ